MSSGSVGSDENMSGAKLEPMASPIKEGVPRDDTQGVIGTDEGIDQARIEPGGGKGQYQHPAPHADDHGVVGTDGDIEKAKIDPLASDATSEATAATTGLSDESVDAARVEPMGEVREEI